MTISGLLFQVNYRDFKPNDYQARHAAVRRKNNVSIAMDIPGLVAERQITFVVSVRLIPLATTTRHY